MGKSWKRLLQTSSSTLFSIHESSLVKRYVFQSQKSFYVNSGIEKISNNQESYKNQLSHCWKRVINEYMEKPCSVGLEREVSVQAHSF